MLFNSYVFILIFLPITWLGFHLLNLKRWFTLSKCWLVLASLTFIGFYSLKPIPVLLFSIAVNFTLSRFIKENKWIFRIGLLFNLGLLGYFKYANFFLENFSDLRITHLLLPLGISYYTIQQISFLIDTYEGVTDERNLLDYILYVVFFPKLIAGPIAHHAELLGQFKAYENKIFSAKNINVGIFLFILGLFKKVIIADTFSGWVDASYSDTSKLHLFPAWGTSLGYVFQLYFDFSGYTDMALGTARLFNIQLPQNFNSPLTSRHINEFWSKWHITLSTFIRTYMFTPFVRLMPSPTFFFSMVAMFLAMTMVGLWHGAAWTFVIYGSLHGLAIVTQHTWKKKKKKLSPWLGWFLTFNFINASFVIFRAKNFVEVKHVFRGMLGLQGIQIPKLGIKPLLKLKEHGVKIGPYMTNEENLQLGMLVLAFVFIFKFKNTFEMERTYEPRSKLTVGLAALFVLCLFGMNRVSEFIYFNF